MAAVNLTAAEEAEVRLQFRNQRWETMWARGLKPGDYFDAKQPLPELVRQVQANELPGGEKALIPGCGRGYDVELLSRSGLYKQVIGLDISATAVTAAKDYLAGVSPTLPANYDVVAEDFFQGVGVGFDLVYDYTFFCALPPEMRAKWGSRMGELVSKGGSLVTVMFPMGKNAEDGGPPHGVSVKAYERALGEAFVPRDGPRVLENSRTHAGRGDGKTWWCRWERV